MRILSVRFKNLNSLAGEWEVDFTHPAYTADGIFAITGPTGAGKSTLLDAMCLALYGKTPRLDSITQSSNEIMTRQTGDCYAEVAFTTQHGSYRCHWAQQRARKKVTGKLQRPRHEIVDADTGKVLAHQLKTVEAQVEQVTGMDFSRFTQSMLLAQGGFTAFLRARPDERAPILEKITGTRIYGDISIKVHERLASEHQQLDTLQAELRGMHLLTPGQEAELQAEEDAQSQALSKQSELAEQLRKQRDWALHCQQLEQKIETLSQDHANWQARDSAFDEQRQRLAAANRALELSGAHATLTALRSAQQQDQQSIETDRAKLPALEQAIQQHQKQADEKSTAHKAAEQTLIDMQPVLMQVHVLDSRIDVQVKELGRLKTAVASRTQALDQERGKLKNTKREIAEKTGRLQDKNTAADTSALLTQAGIAHEHSLQAVQEAQACLDSALQDRTPSQWRQRRDELLAELRLLDSLTQQHRDYDSLTRQRKNLILEITETRAELEKHVQALAHAKNVLDTQKKLQRSLYGQRALQQKILSLEEQRTELREGEPCPLCGSADHPFAQHAPAPDMQGIQAQILEAESKLARLEEQHRRCQAAHIRMSSRLEHLQTQLAQHDDKLAALNTAMQTLCQRLDLEGQNPAAIAMAGQALKQRLSRQAGEISDTLNQIDALQAQLNEKKQAELATRDKLYNTRSAINEIEHLKKTLTTQQESLEQQEREATELATEASRQEDKLQAVRAERVALLDDRDPDTEEAALRTALSHATEEFNASQQQLRQAETRLREAQQGIKLLRRNITARTDKLAQAEKKFTDALTEQQFHNEEAFLSAQLSETERKTLESEAQALARQGIELDTSLTQTRQTLDSEVARQLSEQPLQNLEQQLQEQSAVLSQLHASLGALQQKLKDNEAARQQQRKLTDRIDTQKAETARWSTLHDLIGSADGKKFRNFAQGLTFELMIQHANTQLQKMTDRYLLVRDHDQPLDLNVIDNYQAGEVRSTKNLSGGESFIVSLALALGLSRMASRNVRVDSLFLDEGFGTLDDEALDVALDTLASLQQEGKLIGVISHVSALKERIGTQIQLLPQAGGLSHLQGPGCRALPVSRAAES